MSVFAGKERRSREESMIAVAVLMVLASTPKDVRRASQFGLDCEAFAIGAYNEDGASERAVSDIKYNVILSIDLLRKRYCYVGDGKCRTGGSITFNDHVLQLNDGTSINRYTGNMRSEFVVHGTTTYILRKCMKVKFTAFPQTRF